MNLRFSFEIEYNDSYGQFVLIIVLNLELSVWTIWESHNFILHSCAKVKFIFLNLMKFRYNAFLFVL